VNCNSFFLIIDSYFLYCSWL